MFILASASPRRKELLGEIVSEFTVLPSGEEERAEGATPSDVVLSLARQKAESVARAHPEATVLGADTVVVKDGKILGKPKSEEEAFSMLSSLAGKVHSVFTGVCLIAGGKRFASFAETKVILAPLSEREIRAYVATGSPMDKAGAYGIQDEGIVSSYQGSYTNVVGLPIELVKDLLKQAEVKYE